MKPSNQKPPTPTRTSFWPYALILYFAVFITAVVTYASFAIANDVELVTADYYERELVYADQMIRIARTQALKPRPQFTWQAEPQKLHLVLPPAHAGEGTHGEIHFYHPANAAADLRVPLTLNTEGRQDLPWRSLRPGFWRARVEWSTTQESYYFEAPLNVSARAVTVLTARTP